MVALWAIEASGVAIFANFAKNRIVEIAHPAKI